mmetsp:Transcript_63109/g.112163  ORF Transcript_63109/g.112163 Transcript_63109/m.112163 type:complete len:551 (-) Transcript_63109:81-1733(-)|eukprot:CAMPEP_0197630960 /NCGR_PEP_ID=MMETSP1338-20131121/8284_1 /TAXON_ID=43686 ORGANISM="Pelagodinium beii, Strain RCC1491" /NCGR_SAMPLE_ID=MMETSP1338 /ASSEMBLY_ACC=CAM_ASM_000754 /LENGTH=550 /DNA_ID=CAMNT_0043202315 /DNA_START=40 /DNA_END=1692 /DNA_ORIENTATION=-
MTGFKRSFALLFAVFFWCCAGKVEQTCAEDDSVTLLHTAKAYGLARKNESSELEPPGVQRASSNATHGVAAKLLSLSKFYSHAQQLSNKSVTNSTQTAAEPGSSGLLGLLGPLLLIALVMGCCAIATTNCFLQQQSLDHSDWIQSRAALQQRRRSVWAGMQAADKKVAQEKALQQSRPPSAAPTMGTPHGQMYQQQLLQQQQLQSQLGKVRQVVVRQPVDGDRLGINLTETTLVITAIADPRAEAAGFVVGEQIVLVNGVPVMHQADFQLVLAQAMQQFRQTGQPIVVSTRAHPEDAKASQLPVFHDLTGHWICASGESFSIRRVPGQDGLGIEAQLGSVLARGQLLQEGPELATSLWTNDGLELGQVRISYEMSEQTLVCNLRQKGSQDWHEPLHAQRAEANPQAPPQQPPPQAPPQASGQQRSDSIKLMNNRFAVSTLPKRPGASLSESVGVGADEASSLVLSEGVLKASKQSTPPTGLPPSTSPPPTLPAATSLPQTLPEAPPATSLPARLPSADDSSLPVPMTQPVATPVPTMPAMQSVPVYAQKS